MAQPGAHAVAGPAIIPAMSPTWIWMQAILVVLIVMSMVIAITKLA